MAGLAASCSSAAKRIASPRVRSSPSGSASSARDRGGVLAERLRVRLQGGHRLEHLERVAVDVAVVEDVLLDAAQRGQLGQHDGDDAEVLGEQQPLAGALGADDPLELGEDALGGHPGQPGRLPAHLRARVRVELEAELDREARRAQRPQRVVRERGRRDHPQPPRLEVGPPAVGVDGSPPASGSAIALIVKSRAARSAARSSSRRRTRSTFQPPPRPTTRHAPNAPESSNAVPPAARAIARAAACGSPASATSKSAVARPSRRSRTAPPTSQAGSPASAARAAVERVRHGPWTRGTRAEIPQVTS